MGIIDILSKHNEQRKGFFENLKIINDRVDELLRNDFVLEAATLTIVSIEEFLRIDVEFLQYLFESNAFNIRDEKLNVLAHIDFSSLGLRPPEDLTFGQLIKRHYSFTKIDGLKAELDAVNHMRTTLLHKLLRSENKKYIHSEKESLKEFILNARAGAVRLHELDDKIVKEFLDGLVRKTSQTQ